MGFLVQKCKSWNSFEPWFSTRSSKWHQFQSALQGLLHLRSAVHTPADAVVAPAGERLRVSSHGWSSFTNDPNDPSRFCFVLSHPKTHGLQKKIIITINYTQMSRLVLEEMFHLLHLHRRSLLRQICEARLRLQAMMRRWCSTGKSDQVLRQGKVRKLAGCGWQDVTSWMKIGCQPNRASSKVLCQWRCSNGFNWDTRMAFCPSWFTRSTADQKPAFLHRWSSSSLPCSRKILQSTWLRKLHKTPCLFSFQRIGGTQQGRLIKGGPTSCTSWFRGLGTWWPCLQQLDDDSEHCCAQLDKIILIIFKTKSWPTSPKLLQNPVSLAIQI